MFVLRCCPCGRERLIHSSCCGEGAVVKPEMLCNPQRPSRVSGETSPAPAKPAITSCPWLSYPCSSFHRITESWSSLGWKGQEIPPSSNLTLHQVPQSPREFLPWWVFGISRCINVLAQPAQPCVLFAQHLPWVPAGSLLPEHSWLGIPSGKNCALCYSWRFWACGSKTLCKALITGKKKKKKDGF